MKRAVADKGRTVRIPIHMIERLSKVVPVERQLVQQLARQPRPGEIAAELEMTGEEVREILRMAKAASLAGAAARGRGRFEAR